MIILSASAVSLSFGTDVILDRVSLGVNEGDKIGVVGVNGAGKSLFMKILASVISPTDGEIFLAKDKTVGYLEQNTGFDSDKEMFEEMCLAFPTLVKWEERLSELEKLMNDSNDESTHMMYAKEYTDLEDKFKREGGYEYKSRISSMLVGLGFGKETHSMLINTLSGGQKTRLAIARLLLSEPDILMLDEPTNHLDVDAKDSLKQAIKDFKGTVILVSHEPEFYEDIVTDVWNLENWTTKIV